MLLKHYQPWLIKQGKILQDMYGLGANESVEEARSTFLKILFLYDPKFKYKPKSKKKNKKGFRKVFFGQWLRMKYKMGWSDAEKVTKRRKDERVGITRIQNEEGISELEIRDVIEANFPKEVELYQEVFNAVLMAKWPKSLLAEELGVPVQKISEAVTNLKEAFKKELDPEG